MIDDEKWQHQGVWGDEQTPEIEEKVVKEDLSVEVLVYRQGMRVLTPEGA